MITAETITNAMIRDLRRAALNDADIGSVEADDICKWCARALDDGRLRFSEIREARGVCADILNAREAAGRKVR